MSLNGLVSWFSSWFGGDGGDGGNGGDGGSDRTDRTDGPLVNLKHFDENGTLQSTVTVGQNGDLYRDGNNVGTVGTGVIDGLVDEWNISTMSARYGDSLKPQEFDELTLNTSGYSGQIHAEHSMPLDLYGFMSAIRGIVYRERNN